MATIDELLRSIETISYVSGYLQAIEEDGGNVLDEVSLMIRRELSRRYDWMQERIWEMEMAEVEADEDPIVEADPDPEPVPAEEPMPEPAPVEEPEPVVADPAPEPEPEEDPDIAPHKRKECRGCSYYCANTKTCDYVLIAKKPRPTPRIDKCDLWAVDKPKRRSYNHSCRRCGKTFTNHNPRLVICPECLDE